MSQLIVADIEVRTDSEGRYCLNDLHKAAGGEERHKPNRFTRTDSFIDLVNELTPEMAFAPIQSVRGGTKPGTYVVKELIVQIRTVKPVESVAEQPAN